MEDQSSNERNELRSKGQKLVSTNSIKKSSRRIVISRQPVTKLACKLSDNRSSARNELLTLETRKRILVSKINHVA